MNISELKIEYTDLNRLLHAANADAALLYLYLRCGNSPADAPAQLRLPENRLSCALALLRQLGLWQPEQKQFIAGERPSYSELDVMTAMDTDHDFRALYGELQRQLGRTLNTEEMKIILGFVRYLNLPPDVICVLVCYCKDRARRRGNLRSPSLRTIEKEAYAWAEMGIDTMEEAAAFLQRQNLRHSQLGQLMEVLQIWGRSLTASEEKYAHSWLEMGFDTDVFIKAHDKTCLNTGSMNWRYMNRVLQNWHNAGAHTLKQIEDLEKHRKITPRGATGQLGEAELSAIRDLLQEE